MAEGLESRTLLSTTWYVSPAGSNNNPGSLAQPLQTIQQAANDAQPGDVVAIEGGVYRETVTEQTSGTAAQPITFEAYNSQPVTLDGANVIAGWTQTSPNIWTAPIGWNLGQGNNQVFVDGTMINEARWPNTSLDVSHPTLATVQSAINPKPAATAAASGAVATSTINDAAMNQPAGFWVGGQIHIASGQAWVTQTGAVTASGPGWITFSYTSNGEYGLPSAGNHFYLTGVPAALNAPGEWSISNGQLSIWLPTGDSPANHVIEAKARLLAFDLTGASYINIQGINIFSATIATSGQSRNVRINQIVAQYLSQFDATYDGWHQPANSGIMLNGSYDALTNSLIAYSAGDGVFVGGSCVSVLNNVIHDVDYQAGDSAAICSYGLKVNFSGNTIYSCGRDGILDDGAGGRVEHNVIHDFALQTTDTGGIYTIGTNGAEAEIAYNVVYNGLTAGNGGTGLFLDNDSSDFLVDHNITYNVDTALKMNMTSLNNLVLYNTLDATKASVNRTWGTWDWTGSVLEDNLFTRGVLLGANVTTANNINNRGYFVNPAIGNYQLTANSPAIGAAIATRADIVTSATTDPDAGAIPYGQTPFASGAVIGQLSPAAQAALNPPAAPTVPAKPVTPVTPVVPVTPTPVVPVTPAPVAPVGPTPVVPVTPTPVVPVTPTPVVPVTPAPTVPPVSPADTVTAGRDAKSGISGLSYDAQQGNEAATYGAVGYLFNNDWLEYAGVDFGAGVSHLSMQIAVSNKYVGRQIQLRLDSPTGAVIGALTTVGTGGWDIFLSESTTIAPTSGVHNLYLCMVGDCVGNIQSFQFS